MEGRLIFGRAIAAIGHVLETLPKIFPFAIVVATVLPGVVTN
jgi:hypothetical protein